MRPFLRKTGISTIALAVALTVLSIPVGSAARGKSQAKAAQLVLGCANKKTGRLRIVRSTRGCKLRRERLVRWNVRGPRGLQGLAGERGAQGPAGPAGPVGPTGPPSASVLSARLTGVSGLLSPAFGSPSGTNAVSGTESSVETLGPARSISATNLAVRSSAAPGAGNSVTVTLRANGTNTSVTCTIADPATTCTDVAHSASIPAGSTLALAVTSTLTTLPIQLMVGLETR